MITIAIDPGIKKCACACLVDGELREVWFEAVAYGGLNFARPYPRIPADSVDVVVEQPEYHGARSDQARTQDLLALAWHGALLAGQFAGRDQARTFAYPVSEWKGTTPKPMHHHHVWGALVDSEKRLLGGQRTADAIAKACEKHAMRRGKIKGVECYPRSFETHNLLDAVALGLHHVGRFRIV